MSGNSTRKTLADACGIAPATFAAWRDESLARRAEWLARAEALKPRLFRRNIAPSGLVRIARDEKAFLGWRAVSAGAAEAAQVRPLAVGDSFIFDFGEHIVGHLSFRLVGFDKPVDAPVRLSFFFAETPLELAPDLSVPELAHTISQAWIQCETTTFDDVPSHVRLPRRYAFRYVRVKVDACSGGGLFGLADTTAEATTSADETRLLPWTPPSPEAARLDAIARRTLRDCMQTVFEDGPKRDRRLWLGDLRLEALANYATYRNLALVERSLFLLAGLADDDALVRSDAYERPVPQRGNCRILDYTALLAAAVREWLEAGGDRTAAESLWPLCARQAEFLLHAVDADGVFRDDGKWWCFIDHNAALDRQTAEQGAIAFGLRATIALALALGRDAEVMFLADAIACMERGARERLWDETRGVFVCENGGQVSQSGQAWMVLGGLVTGEEAQLCLLDTLANPAAVRPVSPYAVHGVVEALHATGLHREANKRLYAYWGRMADAGADTFWEVFVPEDPLASPYGTPLLNSHCHAWSCAPAWFLRKVKGADCR